jgi:alkylation response protein AidB-like acyl-CoA dehydrogenase
MDGIMIDGTDSLFQEAARFARAELGGDVAARDGAGAFWREGYRRCGEAGLLGLPVPRDYGGRGAGLLEAVAAMEAAMAKLHVSECFAQNSLDAVRTFGASGFACELGLERDLRDSVGGLIFSGTNDIQRNIIAQQLRL